MWIFWILLNIRHKYSDKEFILQSECKMNKTEKIISVLYSISQSSGHRITESKLLQLLGNPSKANRYKLIDELTKGMGAIPPILIKQKDDYANERIYKLNNQAWDNFVFAGDEGYFFLEAFKKLGNVINCDYTKMAFNDAFEYDGKKVTNLERKFYYLNKIETKMTPLFKENLDLLVEALISNKKIKITYTPAGKNNDYEREIEPLTLCQYRDDLYILCNKIEADSKIQRHYKVSRIKSIKLLGKFKYPTKTKWDPESIFNQSSGMFTGEEKLATFRVYGHSRTAFKEKTFFNALLIEQTSDYDQYQCKYSNENEFIGQLFVYGQDIEIMASSELKKQFLKKAKDVLARNDSSQEDQQTA